jgi:autophagy-related protein 17
MVTLKSPGREDRKRWKTLRDFVDERAIEDVLETVESDRSALDVRSVPYIVP